MLTRDELNAQVMKLLQEMRDFITEGERGELNREITLEAVARLMAEMLCAVTLSEATNEQQVNYAFMQMVQRITKFGHYVNNLFNTTVQKMKDAGRVDVDPIQPPEKPNDTIFH